MLLWSWCLLTPKNPQRLKLYQGLEYYCDSPDHILFGGIWTLEPWVMKTVECFQCCLMDHTGMNMKNNSIENDLDCGDQEVSEDKNIIM